MRIMTGAPIPAGADAVIPLEETDRGLAQVAIRRPARQRRRCIRRAGEDLAGRRTRARRRRRARTAADRPARRDRARPRHRPPPAAGAGRVDRQRAGRGRTRRPASARCPTQTPTCSRRRPRTPERTHAGSASCRTITPTLLDVLESQLLRADVLVTTGGVSMGAFDVVKQALSELGTVEFVRVAMQPGKPQGFGHLGDRVPIFCLPGNPVSALVSFEVFVRPAIRKLLGKRNLQRATVQAVRARTHREPGRRSAVPPRRAAPRGERRVQRVLRRWARLAPDRRRWPRRTAWSSSTRRSPRSSPGRASP